MPKYGPIPSNVDLYPIHPKKFYLPSGNPTLVFLFVGVAAPFVALGKWFHFRSSDNKHNDKGENQVDCLGECLFGLNKNKKKLSKNRRRRKKSNR